MRRRLEFVLVWAAVKLLSLPPRSVARSIGASIGRLALLLTPRLAGVGDQNLRLAFPEKTAAERQQILRKLYRNLGWLLAEFCQMPRYTPEDTRSFIRYEGLEHYLAARDEGKGVLILTGHLGAWELSSFYHSLMGYPMSIVIRRLDNPLVDNLVNHIRCLHGNQVLHKDDFARGLLASMRRGDTVGILMDTNMTPPQGSFVDFFGSFRLYGKRPGADCHENRRPGACPASCSGKKRPNNTCFALAPHFVLLPLEMWRRMLSPIPPCSPG